MPPKRALWSEDKLVAVIQAKQCGRQVPRRTIRNHLQTTSLKKTLGRKPLLNDEQEAEFVSRIERFSAIGLPVTLQILRQLVFKFCEMNDIKHPFNQQAKVPGKDWFRKFMKRHPEISRRKAQFMNPSRAQKLNKFIADDHFQRLDEVYDKLDLKTYPEKIYNMDEKCCENGSFSSDDEDNIPLAQVKRISFKQLLPTPAKNTEKTPTVRRKAINYRGTPVTKDLFNKHKIEKKTLKIKKTREAESSKENRESWYCHACHQGQETAMRMCHECSKWYHEECVGLSEEDDDDFE